MRDGSVGDEAAGQRGSLPSAGRLLVVMGVAVLVGGACLALIWSTLNAFGSESMSSGRLLLAGLSAAILLALVIWSYRALTTLASAGRGSRPSPAGGPERSGGPHREDEGEAH
jgi:hypothetical protein